MRFAKFVVAELLHCQFEGKRKGYYTDEAQLFLQAAKGCCEDEIVNVEDAGPGIFLVKQIVRQYGMTFLMNLISDHSMEWVVPVHLRRSKEVNFQSKYKIFKQKITVECLHVFVMGIHKIHYKLLILSFRNNKRPVIHLLFIILYMEIFEHN